MVGADAVQQRNFLDAFLFKNRMQLADLGLVRSVFAAVEMRQIVPGKNFATVATVFLGAIQRFVGGFNQSINVVRNFGRRNADTDRKAERFTFIRIDDQFGNGFTQTVSNDFGFFRATSER